MIRKYRSVGHVMNMVIMFLSVQKEKRNSKEDLEDQETTFILMSKKKNLTKEKVNMN